MFRIWLTIALIAGVLILLGWVIGHVINNSF